MLPPRLRLAQLPTPLHPLDRLSAELGGPRLWVKRDDLTGSHLSGNKIRKLEYSLAQARDEGCRVIVTCGGIQSNHCRATAGACAQLGLKCHLILRGEDPSDAPDGNLFLDRLFGAEITFYPPEQYNAELPELLEHWRSHYTEAGQKAFAIPTGASDEIGLWGYIGAARELAEQCRAHGFEPEHIVSACGSGGTTGGLTLGAAMHLRNTKVWGVNVSDTAEHFEKKISRDIVRWKERYGAPLAVDQLPVQVIDGYVGPGYAQAEPPVFELIARLARLEGLALDPVYTGKGMQGLLEEYKKGRFAGARNGVFVHTGGLFGTFAQRGQFAF